MNIIDVVSALREGKKIKHLGHLYFMRDDSSFIWYDGQYHGNASIAQFTPEDFAYTDWEIVEEKSPMQHGIEQFKKYNVSYNSSVEQAYQVGWESAERFFKTHR